MISSGACDYRAEPLETRRLLAAAAAPIIDPEPDPDPPIIIRADRFEPNDSFAAATDLGSADSIRQNLLTIHAGGNDDYFRLTPASSGRRVVEIAFDPGAADLDLYVYDTSQNLVASATTEAPGESVTFNVNAGQTYYVKVSSHGSGSAAYSLSSATPGARFDWTMPARFGGAGGLDQWGLPVIHNTAGHVQPTIMNTASGAQAAFRVRFDGGGTVVGGDSPSHHWTIFGGPLAQPIVRDTAGTLLDIDLPEGTYNVNLAATGAAGTYQANQTVGIVDHLIVAMGDSYSSGEGNPHQNQQFDWAGFVSGGAQWARGGNADETAAHRRGHRSSYAASAQAAWELEKSSSKSSVTFVSLSSSGGTINQGVIGPYAGVEPDGVVDPPQIEKLRGLVGGRKIDSLLLSVGGNDVGFGDIVAGLVAADPGICCWYEDELAKIWDGFNSKLWQLRNEFYPALDAALDTLNVGKVLITEYPDPGRNADGSPVAKILDDIQWGLEVDANELNLVREKVLIPLNNAIRELARKRGWTAIGGISDAFFGHPYGAEPGVSWMRTARDSTIKQGPIQNVNFITVLQLKESKGTLHPNEDGHRYGYMPRMLDAMQKPDLTATAFSPVPDPITNGAGNDFAITLRNDGPITTSPAATVGLYLSDDANVTASDVLVHTINVPALKPGETFTTSAPVNFGSDPFITDNHVYWTFVIDPAGAMAESDEDNNFAMMPMTGAFASDRHFGAIDLVPVPEPVSIGIAKNGSIGDEFIGARDIDVFGFSVPQAGQRLGLDIDSQSLDSFIKLYRRVHNPIRETDSYTLVASNDNGRAPNEQGGSAGDSYLEHTFAQSGDYVLVVSSAANGPRAFPESTLQGRLAGPTGAYSVFIAPAAVPEDVVVSGTAGNDTFHVRREGGEVKIWLAERAVGTPLRVVPYDLLRSLTINGLDGDDAAFVDFTGGPIVPTGGATFHGGNGNDEIRLATLPASAIAVGDAATTIGSATYAHSSVEQTAITSHNPESLTLMGNARARAWARGTFFRTSSLIVGPDAHFDLLDNDLIINAGDEAAIAALVKSARAGSPRWTGPGIGTSLAGPDTGLAVMKNPGLTQLGLAAVDSDDVIVRFTYNGDANLDGRVNADDYFRIDSGFLAQPQAPAYDEGDFNYDGRVNADDYFLIDSAFLGQSSPLAERTAAAAPTVLSVAEPEDLLQAKRRRVVRRR